VNFPIASNTSDAATHITNSLSRWGILWVSLTRPHQARAKGRRRAGPERELNHRAATECSGARNSQGRDRQPWLATLIGRAILDRRGPASFPMILSSQRSCPPDAMLVVLVPATMAR